MFAFIVGRLNVMHAVVAETEKFSKVVGMKRERERDGAEVTLGGNAFHA